MLDRHEQVAQRAYRIWEEAGRPEGRDVEHWLSAESELGPDGGGADAPLLAGPMGVAAPAPADDASGTVGDAGRKRRSKVA